MGVGARLKSALNYLGITIKDVAAITGISQNTLYSITKRDSERVNPNSLNLICDMIGIDKGYMFIGCTGDGDTDIPYSEYVDTRKIQLRPMSIRMDPPEERSKLIKAYDSLNRIGKTVALERVQELTEIPKYQKDKEDEPDND